MFWWGKIVGTLLGFLLARSAGAMIGFCIGHAFDKGLMKQVRNKGAFLGMHSTLHTSDIFFSATFLLMGYVAKAVGRVSEREIHVARGIMQRLGVQGKRRLLAIEFFNQGKQADFNMQETLAELRPVLRHRPALLQFFMEIQLEAAYARGFLDPRKREILLFVAQKLGAPALLFTRLDAMFQAQQRFKYQQQQSETITPAAQLTAAYQILGVKQGASLTEIKRAYRKLMSVHHPDKLAAKGLPKEMMKIATQKTQEIQAAYDKICRSLNV